MLHHLYRSTCPASPPVAEPNADDLVGYWFRIMVSAYSGQRRDSDLFVTVVPESGFRGIGKPKMGPGDDKSPDVQR